MKKRKWFHCGPNISNDVTHVVDIQTFIFLVDTHKVRWRHGALIHGLRHEVKVLVLLEGHGLALDVVGNGLGTDHAVVQNRTRGWVLPLALRILASKGKDSEKIVNNELGQEVA